MYSFNEKLIGGQSILPKFVALLAQLFRVISSAVLITCEILLLTVRQAKIKTSKKVEPILLHFRIKKNMNIRCFCIIFLLKIFSVRNN